MQKTTFNEETQGDVRHLMPDTIHWLHALYAAASLKKFDQCELNHIILEEINFIVLEKNIHYKFQDKKNLIQALMQSTFCYEMKEKSLSSNERLEFLGDSLINFIVGKNLYNQYTKNDEGDLSKLRGALVNEAKLAELARSVGLGNYIFLGKGELKSEGFNKDSILADTFEALFAAMYLDSQSVDVLEAAFKQIVSAFEEKTKKMFYSLEELEVFDTKSKLQEMVMALHGQFPTYKSIEIPGGFNVQVWLGERLLAEMEGQGKKKIEKLLAKKIIDDRLYE
ncbi:MAG: ribonuclease III [Bdellovibrionales bacterium]|nr:ribonuclease III [Bdellovibrionales bacterium]